MRRRPRAQTSINADMSELGRRAWGPKGRPPARPIAKELKRLADEQVTLKVDGHRVTMSRLEALAMQAWGQAMKGDFRWGKEVWDRIDGKVRDTLDITTDGEKLGGGFADMSPEEQAAAVKELGKDKDDVG